MLLQERTDGPVIYWMSRDQRIADNWALVYARKRAAAAGVPLVIAFSLAPSFLGATIRHYGFMLRGLAETEAEAERLGIPFVLLVGSPHETIPAFAVAQGASLVVCDFSPLRMGVQWRKEIAAALGDSDKVAQLAAAAGVVTHATTTSSSSGAVPIAVHEVDAHNVVPVRATIPGAAAAMAALHPPAAAPPPAARIMMVCRALRCAGVGGV